MPHVNWGRGETHEYAYRKQEHYHYRDDWWIEAAQRRREIRQSKTVESFYEDTPYKKKAQPRVFRVEMRPESAGTTSWIWGRKKWSCWHKYSTEQSRQDALETLRKKARTDRWRDYEYREIE